MRKLRVVAGIIAAIIPAFAQSASAVGFDVHEVFGLPAHRLIDSRCSDVRTFADRAAKPSEDIVPQDAVVAAQQYIACYRLPRVGEDEANQRYLILSAAASLVLAAEKSNGENRLRLYRGADALVSQLSGARERHVDGLTKEDLSAGQRSRGDEGPELRGGQESTAPFGDVADQMRASIEAQMVQAYQQTPAEPKANASP